MLKISVIVPVYNVGRYLRRCLSSIVQQDLQEIEIIVVNDGSTDDSLSIIREFAVQDSRIIVLDKPNGGISSARNAGLAIAQAEYISHIDGDDWVEKGFLKAMYDFAVANELDIAISDFYTDWDDGRLEYFRDVWLLEECIFDSKKYLRQLFKETAQSAVWNKILRRELYSKHNILHPDHITVGEDIATIIRLVYFAHKVGRLNQAFVHYIQRPSSVVHATSNANKQLDLYKVFILLDNFFAEQSYSNMQVFKNFQAPHLYRAAVACRDREDILRDFIDLAKNYKIYTYEQNTNRCAKLLKSVPSVWLFKFVLKYGHYKILRQLLRRYDRKVGILELDKDEV